MRKEINILLAILFITINITAQQFELIKTIEVAGRQGVATDSEYFYVSGSKSLYKYTKEGKLVASNTSPFEEINTELNHLGDIDYYNGDIFAGAEYFNDGSASNIRIVIYDSKTLKFKKLYAWEPKSGQKEVCGITVDAKNKTVWMADWIHGAYLYKYDLESGEYLGRKHIFPVPEKQQGIKVWNNKIYITADDGDAEDNEADNLYTIPIIKTRTNAQSTLIKTFDDIKLNGEIEGLTFDETNNTLIVLFNRGTRVVNGMPIGFYPGYSKEIHELYIYKIIN